MPLQDQRLGLAHGRKCHIERYLSIGEDRLPRTPNPLSLHNQPLSCSPPLPHLPNPSERYRTLGRKPQNPIEQKFLQLPGPQGGCSLRAQAQVSPAEQVWAAECGQGGPRQESSIPLAINGQTATRAEAQGYPQGKGKHAEKCLPRRGSAADCRSAESAPDVAESGG